MTLPSTPRRAGPYVGNLVTTSFPFGFKAFSPGDVTVVLRVGDTETILTYGVNYGVTLNADQDQFPGGNVLYPVGDDPMPASESITIISSIPYNQQTKLPSGGQFRPQVVENAFDRIVAQIQQLAEQNARQVGMPVSYNGSELKLPFPQPGKLLAWNNGGTGLVNVDSDVLVNVAGFTSWHTQRFTGGVSSFTLSEAPASIKSLTVAVDGLLLDGEDGDFSLNGTSLSITGGTPPGSRVFVRWGEALPEGNFPASHSGYLLPVAGASNITVQARLANAITPESYLAPSNGNDATAAFITMLANVPNGSVIDLGGKSYAVYSNTSGVTTGDAAALQGVLRLFGKSNITIRNGTIYAKNPSVSGVKYRFPTVLTIDGCENIKLENLNLYGKGESWGDADASFPLNVEQRRAFCAQNGGHALLIARSKNVEVRNCRTVLSGSVAPLYVTSSAKVRCYGTFSSPKSLGYAAFAADSWCGGVGVSGFDSHDLELHDCSTDDDGAMYGSKGGVFAEDGDVVVRVYGGKYADCYANGGAHFIGPAFASVNARVYVQGAEVDNCASIGLTYHSANGTSRLECDGVSARNLRTSMHINHNNSFGDSVVLYRNCSARYANVPSLWGSDELSQLTVIANQKVSSPIVVELTGCDVQGAKYLSLNKRGCYGGIKIVGGFYAVEDQIFNSAGWGGSGPGSLRGFEITGGARIYVASTTLTAPISTASNNDGQGVSTYLHVDIDSSVTIESAIVRSTESFADTTGGTLTDRMRLEHNCVNCASLRDRSGRGGSVRVVSLDGVFGSNYRLTVAYPRGFPVQGVMFDDGVVARSILSYQSVPAIAGGELRAQINVSGASNAFTVGAFYPVSGR